MAECRHCGYYIPDGATWCAHCGAFLRKFSWKILFRHIATYATALAAIATATAAIFVGRQTKLLEEQTIILKDRGKIENRPYLYVDIKPRAFSEKSYRGENKEEYDNLYVGATLTYKNVGRLPACNINSDIRFYVDTSEEDKYKDFKKWYIRQHGNYPEPSTVFSSQDDIIIAGNVDVPEETKDFLVSIRVSYTEKNTEEKVANEYWYRLDAKFVIDKEDISYENIAIIEDGKIKQIPTGKKLYDMIPVYIDSDYDRMRDMPIGPPLPKSEFILKLKQKVAEIK